jgi:hypothetical protein
MVLKWSVAHKVVELPMIELGYLVVYLPVKFFVIA